MEVLTCPRCHQAKPVDEFYPSRYRRTGRSAYCKVCHNEKSQESYYKHHTRRRAKQDATTKAKRQAKDPEFLAKRCALQRKRRQQFPDEDAAIAKRYRERHPERITAARQVHWQGLDELQREIQRQRLRLYKLANREHVWTVHTTWRHANRHRMAVLSARRRARKAAAPRNDLTAVQWEVVLQAFGYRCAYCHKKRKPLTQDHITPYALGGSNTLWNVVPACKSCNSKKGTKAPLIPVQPLLL